MPEPSKQEFEALEYQLWERVGRPKDREAEFWHLAEHSCAIRTNPRRPAPLDAVSLHE